MKYRKIKNLNRPGNRQEKTEKQIEASRKSGILVMLTKNPMKNSEIRKKFSRRMKGKHVSLKTEFKKGNQLGRVNKGNIKQIEAGRITGIKNIGRKMDNKLKEEKRIAMILKNPMKNSEIIKKNIEARKRNKMIKANEKRRKAALTNKNIRKNWFMPKELLTDKKKESLIKLYKEGFSILTLAKEFNLYKGTIRKLLVVNNIKIRNTRNRDRKEVK